MGGAPTRHRGRSRYPTRSRNAGAPVATSSPSFNPLTGWTTDPLHGVWASDPLWVPPADGGAVSSWRNGGTVGGDLVQGTGAAQPTYRAAAAAFNNKATVQFDGTDDRLLVDPANIAAPWYVVTVASITNATGKLLGTTAGLRWGLGKGTTVWDSFSGAVLSGGTPDTNPHLFVSTVNGASSSIVVDGTTAASGNAGSEALEILCLGSRDNVGTGSLFLAGHVAYLGVFNTNPTALPEWAAFKAWVTSTYGIAVA